MTINKSLGYITLCMMIYFGFQGAMLHATFALVAALYLRVLDIERKL